MSQRKKWDILVLQDSIRYCIGEDLPEQSWTLTEFRPQIQFPNTKSVFLTPVYNDAIKLFLDRDMEGGRYSALSISDDEDLGLPGTLVVLGIADSTVSAVGGVQRRKDAGRCPLLPDLRGRISPIQAAR